MTITLQPIRIGTRTDSGRLIEVGELVRYTGRRRGEEHTTFYVIDIDEDVRDESYTIVDRDYPGVTEMYGLHRGSISPLGHRVELCGSCGHEAGNPGRMRDQVHCEAFPDCMCRQHADVRPYEED